MPGSANQTLQDSRTPDRFTPLARCACFTAFLRTAAASLRFQDSPFILKIFTHNPFSFSIYSFSPC